MWLALSLLRARSVFLRRASATMTFSLGGIPISPFTSTPRQRTHRRVHWPPPWSCNPAFHGIPASHRLWQSMADIPVLTPPVRTCVVSSTTSPSTSPVHPSSVQGTDRNIPDSVQACTTHIQGTSLVPAMQVEPQAATAASHAVLQAEQWQGQLSVGAVETGVPDEDQAELLSRWHGVVEQLSSMSTERHTPNRKHRAAELRAELMSIQSALPLSLSQQLEQRLIQARAEASRTRKARLQAALKQGPTVVVDCSFAVDFCRPGIETRSLAKQVEWAMAVNRCSERPLALHATSWLGDVAQFGEYIGCKGWEGVVLHEATLADVFPTEKIVVLSPDADEPLMHINPDDVYVVGGIVDRTVKKGITADFAATNALRSARLPIAEHASSLGLDVPGACTRPVLNVSDVVIALIEAYRTGGDWFKALDKAMPERKRRPKQTVAKPKKMRVVTPGMRPRVSGDL